MQQQAIYHRVHIGYTRCFARCVYIMEKRRKTQRMPRHTSCCTAVLLPTGSAGAVALCRRCCGCRGVGASCGGGPLTEPRMGDCGSAAPDPAPAWLLSLSRSPTVPRVSVMQQHCELQPLLPQTGCLAFERVDGRQRGGGTCIHAGRFTRPSTKRCVPNKHITPPRAQGSTHTKNTMLQ